MQLYNKKMHASSSFNANEKPKVPQIYSININDQLSSESSFHNSEEYH